VHDGEDCPPLTGAERGAMSMPGAAQALKFVGQWMPDILSRLGDIDSQVALRAVMSRRARQDEIVALYARFGRAIC
jgi:hypothetical protein